MRPWVAHGTDGPYNHAHDHVGVVVCMVEEIAMSRNPVWSRLADPVLCDRCHGRLSISQPDESRPRVLLGVCVRPGCDAGWTVLYYARGDQRWSDQPYARVSCPIDPPPAVSPLRLHSPRT